MSLAGLIPDAEFGFRMRFERGTFAQFFGPTADRPALLDERRRWLRTAPGQYAALLPEGIPLLHEAIELAQHSASLTGEALPGPLSAGSPWQRCLALGERWEPDFLLLKPDAENQVRLWAACVCFPSSWDLAEKMGQPMERIHGVVPGLNQEIGPQIHSFLTRLKPGVAWERTNWGLSRSPELNQHPARHLPRLDASVEAAQVWFRVEHQALVALPRTGGILFGIRLRIIPLVDVAADSDARRRLAQALQTMPDAMAEYKGLGSARARILELIQM